MSTRIRPFSRRLAAADPRVVAWRREQLRAAGFPALLAEEAASDERLDLHAGIELVERGCDPSLALRILAPIDERETSSAGRVRLSSQRSPRHDKTEVIRVTTMDVRAPQADAISRAAYQAFWLLRVGFTVAPILFGIDKFFNWTVHWPDYLAGWINNIMPGTAQDFMYFVGGVEIAAGLIVAVAPMIGAPLVAAWLAGIIINLLTNNPPEYYDIALRDFGLMLAALTLTRLAWAFGRRGAGRVGERAPLRLRRAA